MHGKHIMTSSRKQTCVASQHSQFIRSVAIGCIAVWCRGFDHALHWPLALLFHWCTSAAASSFSPSGGTACAVPHQVLTYAYT